MTHASGKVPWFANGWSPIHECCAWGNTDAAHWLVANGADAGRADNFQLSPLHTASFHGHVDMIQALVDFRVCGAVTVTVLCAVTAL